MNEILVTVGVDRKDMRIIVNQYWNQLVFVRVGNRQRRYRF